jgi:hypothetical protein
MDSVDAVTRFVVNPSISESRTVEVDEATVDVVVVVAVDAAATVAGVLGA